MTATTITAELAETRTFGTSQVRGTVVHADDLVLALIGETYREICSDCSGTGYRPGYGFSDGSRCWPCGYSGLGRKVGTGTLAELVKLITRRKRDAARRQAKREEAAALAAAAHVIWAAERPEAVAAATAVLATVPDHDDYDSPASAFSPRLVELSGGMNCRVMTDKQVALLLSLYATETQRIAAKAAATAKRDWIGEPFEKVEFTGRVIYRTTSESYGRTSTFLRVVTAEGHSVSWWRTGYHETQTGETITVKATVKELKDTHQYGKETVVTHATVQD